NCAACHGPDGKAGTEIAALLDPRPSDLAAPAAQGRSDDEIYAAITHGLTGRGMPAYGQRLGDAERRELAAYVRQLPKAAAAAAAPPAAGAAAPAPDEQRYTFAGQVVSVDPARRQVMIAHEEIQGFMGAMTMAFPLKDERLYQVLKAGDRLRATLVIDGDGWRLDEVIVDK
ncbi:MAG TPA: copper-binding protein, partial [Blastocatellia bacterium]|nr:copper-binding protein [Blastocatellia bacterium]